MSYWTNENVPQNWSHDLKLIQLLKTKLFVYTWTLQLLQDF